MKSTRHIVKVKNVVKPNYFHKYIVRHTANTVVLWLTWIIANDSYFQIDDDKVLIFSQSSAEERVNWRYTAPYITQMTTERIDLVRDTHSSEYAWQAYDIF